MKRILTLTALLLFAAMPVLFAQEGPHACPSTSPSPAPMMKCQGGDMGECDLINCKELNLTNEQTAKIKESNFAYRKLVIDMKADLEKAQLNMRHEMRSAAPDKAKALSFAKEMNAIQGKMAEARLNHMFELRAVLTPEQTKKLNDCQQNCMMGDGPMRQGKGKGCDKTMGQGCGKMMEKSDQPGGGCQRGK